MPIVRTPVATLEYEERGEGTPVLFLHGFPDAPRTWHGVINRLEGVRAILPYQRGYGGSTVSEDAARGGEPAALALDVVQLADALGLDAFHVVGHDWGSRAAMQASLLAPGRVKGIVALASPYVMNAGGKMPPSQIQAYWYQWYFNTSNGGREFGQDPLPICRRLWEVWSPRYGFTDEEFQATAEAWKNPQWVETALNSYRYRYQNEPGAPLYERQAACLLNNPKIEVPTLYAHGHTEGCVLPESADGQEEWFAHYERSDVPAAGHFIQREDPEAVAALVRRMLGASR